MPESRFRDNRQSYSVIGRPTQDDPVLVICPKCNGKSSIIPHRENEVKCTCFNCGYTAVKSCNEPSFNSPKQEQADSYFGFELWLKTNCLGQSLWALNNNHLAFLESYVNATLRERPLDQESNRSNSSFASRLPQWIKSAKNRASVLKAINELKSKG